MKQIQIMKFFYFIKSILLFCKIRIPVCVTTVYLHFSDWHIS